MADDQARDPSAKGAPKCPACGRPGVERFRPFCSARCRDRDLLNWFGGRYAIPAQEIEPDDLDEDAPGGG